MAKIRGKRIVQNTLNLKNRQTDMINNLLASHNLTIVEVIFDPILQLPSLYTVTVTGEDKDYAINENGIVIFYKEISNTNQILKKYLGDVEIALNDTNRLLPCCIVGEMIYSIQHSTKVKNSWLLDSVNLLLDIIHTVNSDFPEYHKKRLYRLADHLTFNYYYKKLFDEPGCSRNELLESIYWSIGYIFSHAKIK